MRRVPATIDILFPLHMRLAVFAAVILSCAVGCGQKGNLYLRDSPPAGMRPAKPEPYQPVPYPKEAGEEGEAAKK
jgi:predicted small lipoprotein YifL